jgi:hypothetical protein
MYVALQHFYGNAAIRLTIASPRLSRRHPVGCWYKDSGELAQVTAASEYSPIKIAAT